VSPLCVNTLPATKITLIADGIYFGSLAVNCIAGQSSSLKVKYDVRILDYTGTTCRNVSE
jgi:hypothetical protein